MSRNSENQKSSHNFDQSSLGGYSADKPMVSFIVATYNASKYLQETIDSIVSQTYNNIELIVIDGGSTDGTVEILTANNDKIHYWDSAPDLGIADAFNKGVAASSGLYINFQGSGDTLCSNLVLAELMNGVDPEKDFVISGKVQRVEESNPSNILWDSSRNFRAIFNKKHLVYKMCLPHQGLLVHKSIFKKYGQFDLTCKFAMDYEFLLRMYHSFPRVVMKNIYFSNWRAGGVGTHNTFEVLREYHKIKIQHQVSSLFTLNLIHYWSICKLTVRKLFSIQYQ